MNQPDVQSSPLECCGIVCNEQTLIERAGGSALVVIIRADIQQIALKHGLQAPHPVLQIAMGFALIALGYFPAVHLIDWMQHGGTFFGVEAWLIPLAAIGAWLVLAALKRGYFLEVILRQGKRRLAFDRAPDVASLDAFIAGIENSYGLRVERHSA